MTAPPKTRLPLAEARAIALDLVELLRPTCARIEVAGSIRRQRADVGGIELVAIPRLRDKPRLFAELAEQQDGLDVHVRALGHQGVLQLRYDVNGRPRFGPRTKYVLYAGVPVDLFAVVAPATWGVIFALRTGPEDYAHQLVTPAGTYFRDSAGRRRGGLLPGSHAVRHGALIYSTGEGTNGYVATPEEIDFFRALGLEWTPPEARK